ncbi:MAG: AAA family ATPase [Candidatus Dormiibacterota bacterium]
MDLDSPSGDERASVKTTGERHAGAAQSSFVGRDREIVQGMAAVEEALTGRGRLLLVAGEPGIGKTRLADELAERAQQRGFRIVSGRCWEAGGAPAYWPWVQSLRSLTRGLSAAELTAQLGTGAVEMAQLLPEIHGVLGTLPDPPAVDPQAARFRFFDSVAAYLTQAAAVRPVMLVLDDLHAADAPSLLLLQFLAGALSDGSRILILGTYRDVELTPDHPLTASLVELTRAQAVRSLTLRGLTEVDVGHLISENTGGTAHGSVARTVRDETEGNPFFVQEVIRWLVDEGRLAPAVIEQKTTIVIPRSVQEVIHQRLKPLSENSRNLLALAAVLGREFNVNALSRLADRSTHDVIAVLDEPLAARVISDTPGVSGRLRFSHVLIRETLYHEIARARRIELHHLAGRALESLYADDPEPHLAELAHHFFQGALQGAVEKAVFYAQSAGARAVSLLAYEEAARLYQLALQGLALSETKDSQERCEVLLALGDAQARAGDAAGSKRSFFQAADLARNSGLMEPLTRAALGYGGRHVWMRAGDDPHLIPLLKDGLNAVGDANSPLRPRIMARLAGALRDDPSPEPRESLSRQAVELARRLGDPATLAYALDGMFGALWRPDNPMERLAIARQVVQLAEVAADYELLQAGHRDLVCTFFELGDMDSVYRELAEAERLAEKLRQPVWKHMAFNERAMLALLEGRFQDAEQWIASALLLGEPSRLWDALADHAGQLFQLRREQGRLTEIEAQITRSAREFTWYPMFRCALAVLHVELGRETHARAEFDEIAAHHFAGLPLDNYWIFNMSLLSEVACFLRDHDRARILYDGLLPYGERNAVGAPEGCTGSVSRALGLLADLLLRPEDAIHHLEEALEQNERMGALPSVARTQCDLAAALIKRGGRSDRERAIELLEKALRACDELGMPPLRVSVRAALDRLGIAWSGVTTDALLSVEDGMLRLEGEYWTVGYQGRMLRLRDSKGMRILARLLALPGRPHPSLDLERLDAGGDQSVARAVAAGDAGELIDDEARRAYRARLAELREAIDDAESWGKADEVGAMREELDFITHELSRALGLGGRARRAGSVSERARLNVTRAVKSAVKRIAASDAGLAAHLQATVHTGTVCVYTPDPQSPITWRASTGDVHKG